MFSKRVKFVRDLHQEISILDKKIKREVSKFSDNVEAEIKKKFRRLNPGIQIKIEKIEADHFMERRNRKNPLLIQVISFNGRSVHEDGIWVSPAEFAGWKASDNEISVEDFEDMLRQLSEDLGVLLRAKYVFGQLVDFD